MNQEVRVIKTQRDYDAALARLSVLMDEEFAQDSKKGAELELLALVIESYERSQIDPIKVDPIEAILFRMDQMNLERKDLVPYLGSLPKVSEVLSGKRALSLSMIRNLYKGLGIPAEVLISGNEDFDMEAEPQYEYSKFPLQEMHERGYFSGFRGDVKRVKEYAEELISKFMSEMKSCSINPALLRAPLHQNQSRLMDDYALLIWRMAVIKKARKKQLSTAYVQGSITSEWLRDLTKLSRFEQGPRLAQEFLADVGIALIIEPHFKKTYLDGAAMLDGDMPIIALTLRHDRLDNFWFALLHETIHVQKHLKKGSENDFIPDNLEDKTRTSQIEKEADDGATEAFIPKEEWDNSDAKYSPTYENVIELANKLRIHPAIVAGRARHETGNWRILGNLLGKGAVCKNFEDQLGAINLHTS
ncbi:type II toxin-antitoxin system HigA family antitoxin [Methylophilus sp. 5]|uniref:helix-turn-helix domain-containing protein n=1 Tax=Methylophilus sp. 5 TaxID=1112274 RepID=UPI00048ACB12|nr:transcriptional regulator [Methylophilus sp. 5]